jgi:hypothetical protein
LASSLWRDVLSVDAVWSTTEYILIALLAACMIAAFILVFVKSVEARAEAFRRRYEVNTKALLEP